jgi:Zn-dependent protease
MRDPFSWAFPLGRLFGITIRVHVLFPLIALGMVLRVAFPKEVTSPAVPYPANLWLDACVVVLLAFFAVLLHELGHCFGARLVDGDAPEVLIWPLGGLAALEIPHTPRANFIATAAGPAVNLLLCILMGLLLAAFSLRPSLNPWANDFDLLAPRLYKWTEGVTYGFRTDYRPGEPTRYTAMLPAPAADGKAGERVATPVGRADVEEKITKDDKQKEISRKWILKSDEKVEVVTEAPALLSVWQVWAARFFWLNWLLFLLNLLPGFPLDGGRILQSILWWRSDYRQATLTAVMVGYVVMLIIVLYAVAIEAVLPAMLAWFIYMTCTHQWRVLEHGGEEALFGYDFSQGYTSLERDQPAPAPPKPKKPNFLQRWLQKRAQRKLQRETEEREAEERRLDELLDKVQRDGLQSLSDEERRFLNRVSSRYKNRHS